MQGWNTQWERKQKHKTNDEYSCLFLTDRSSRRERKKCFQDSEERLREREEIGGQYG